MIYCALGVTILIGYRGAPLKNFVVDELRTWTANGSVAPDRVES